MYKSIVLIIATGLLLAACAAQPPAELAGRGAPAAGSPTDAAQVTQLVEDFGARLKNVSLLAADAPSQIAAQYGDFVTPQLLQAWQANPSQAPGRLTSSPWPERIEVDSVQQVSQSEFRVSGTVFEESSGEGRAMSYLVLITVERASGKWLISGYATPR